MEISDREMISQNKGSMTYLIASIIIFIFIVVISGVLFYINKNIEKSISEVNTTTALFASQIDKLKESTEVATYDIIKTNKDSIESSIEKSRASKYLLEMINISKKYRVTFVGFSFDGKQINTNATYVNKDLKDTAINGVVRFIKDFRLGKNELLGLNPISSVAGDLSKRSFSASFYILK